MANYQFRHPWNPGYALPESILAEPPGRGVYVSKWLPRGTIPSKRGTEIAGAQPGYGYAQPGYVLAEAPLRGVYVTKQLPRRTIGAKAPDYLARPVRKPLKRKHSLSGTSLGDVTHFGGSASANPFSVYGRDAAKVIMTKARALPANKRSPFLQDVLSKLEPGLPARVERSVQDYRGQGITSDEALSRALQVNLGAGMASEVVELGKRGKPRHKPLMGLGATGIRVVTAAQQIPTTAGSVARTPTISKWMDVGGAPIRIVMPNMQKMIQVYGTTYKWDDPAIYGSKAYSGNSLPDLLSKLPPPVFAGLKEREKLKGMTGGRQIWNAVLAGKMPLFEVMGGNAVYVTFPGATGDTLVNARRATVDIKPRPPASGGLISSTLGNLAKILAAPVNLVINGVKFVIKIIEKIGEAVVDVLDKLKDLACDVLNSDLAVAGGSGVAAAYGQEPEVGATGVIVAQQVCGGGGGGYEGGYEEPTSILPWLVVGGGAALLLYAGTRK